MDGSPGGRAERVENARKNECFVRGRSLPHRDGSPPAGPGARRPSSEGRCSVPPVSMDIQGTSMDRA